MCSCGLRRSEFPNPSATACRSEDLANTIAQQFIAYVDANFGEAGECDLRDFANAVFWPMTVALFGKNAGKDAAPDLCALLPTSLPAS